MRLDRTYLRREWRTILPRVCRVDVNFTTASRSSRRPSLGKPVAPAIGMPVARSRYSFTRRMNRTLTLPDKRTMSSSLVLTCKNGSTTLSRRYSDMPSLRASTRSVSKYICSTLNCTFRANLGGQPNHSLDDEVAKGRKAAAPRWLQPHRCRCCPSLLSSSLNYAYSSRKRQGSTMPGNVPPLGGVGPTWRR